MTVERFFEKPTSYWRKYQKTTEMRHRKCNFHNWWAKTNW